MSARVFYEGTQLVYLPGSVRAPAVGEVVEVDDDIQGTHFRGVVGEVKTVYRVKVGIGHVGHTAYTEIHLSTLEYTKDKKHECGSECKSFMRVCEQHYYKWQRTLLGRIAELRKVADGTSK